jgi:hypothetical protein
MASKRSAIETAPALHLLEETGGPRNEDKRNDEQPKANEHRLAAPPSLRPEAAENERAATANLVMPAHAGIQDRVRKSG